MLNCEKTRKKFKYEVKEVNMDRYTSYASKYKMFWKNKMTSSWQRKEKRMNM